MTDAFPTLLTFMRLLPGVGRLVAGERRVLAEGLPTLAAPVGRLPGGDGLVLGRGGGV